MPSLRSLRLFRALAFAIALIFPIIRTAYGQAATTEPATAAPAPAQESAPSAKAPAESAPPPATADESVPPQSEALPEVQVEAAPPAPTEFRRIDGLRRRRAVWSVGSDALLARDESASHVVAVFGNATSAGDVAERVVAVLGDATVEGPVGDNVVAVIGNASVNSPVDRWVVVVLGSLDLGNRADVSDGIVCIGGQITRHRDAVVGGEIIHFPLPGPPLDLEWLKSWLASCAVWGRPLALREDVRWAWMVAAGFLAFYLLLGLFFGKAITKCAETMEQRPGRSIFAAVITVLLLPILFSLLAITGVGLVLVPFLFVGLMAAALLGRAVILAWLGRRMIATFGWLQAPAVISILIGGVVVTALYLVPFVGFLLWNAIGVVGFGVVVYTVLLGMRRERPATTPPRAAGVASSSESPFVTPAPAPVASPYAASGASSGITGTTLIGEVPETPKPSIPPVIAPTSLTPQTLVGLPRAGFWIRALALVIDVIVIGIAGAMLQIIPPVSFVFLAAYGAVMWKLKGATIGAIACNLQVVRLDARPMDWTTAIVRGLGCILSAMVVFLGFIWVAFDDAKQAWHDKIAGTIVVRTPTRISLF